MNAVVVTGYVPLPCAHRSETLYRDLGAQLLAACPRAIAFTQPLAECWLAQHWTACGIEVPPGGKDTLAYFAVQHQKTEWLAQAAQVAPGSTLVWIDFGVMHLGITADHVAGLLAAVEARPPVAITAPSCHALSPVADDTRVDWSFCGGVLVVPAGDAAWFHGQCVAARTGTPPTWEVNTWAGVARQHPSRFRLYPADHNERLFTEYAP